MSGCARVADAEGGAIGGGREGGGEREAGGLLLVMLLVVVRAQTKGGKGQQRWVVLCYVE